MDNYGEGLLGRIAMLEDDLHAMTQARDDALRYCETLQADADKARMKTNYCPSCKGYADRIAALEDEIVEWQKWSGESDWGQGYAAGELKWAEQYAALEAENARLRLAGDGLAKSSGHHENCDSTGPITFPCDCGWPESLKAWREVTE